MKRFLVFAFVLLVSGFGQTAAAQRVSSTKKIYKTPVGTFVFVATVTEGDKRGEIQTLITPGNETLELSPVARPDGSQDSEVGANDYLQTMIWGGKQVYLLTISRLYVWKGEEIGFKDTGLIGPPVEEILDMSAYVSGLFTLNNEMLTFAGLLYLDPKKHTWRTYRNVGLDLGGVVKITRNGAMLTLVHFHDSSGPEPLSTFNLKTWVWNPPKPPKSKPKK